MSSKYVISFLFALCFLALQRTTAQSTLNIISNDSTLLALRINNESITDSFSMEINLSFPSQKKVFLEFLDSNKQTVLKKSLTLHQQFSTDYSLFNFNGNYSLKLLAQSSLEELPNRSLSALAVETSEPEMEPLTTLIVVNSEYNNPGEKQQVFIDSIDDYRFEQEKIKAVKEFLQGKNMSKALITKALLKISYEDKRAEVILDLKDELKGKISKNDLNSLFKLTRYKTAVAAALEIK